MLAAHGDDSIPDWEKVYDHIQRFPQEVMNVDRRGRTCLSAAACAAGSIHPPTKVVKAMMRACRFGTEASCDKSGKTALHLAILAETPDMEVIQELCSNSPKLVSTTDFRARTPLHFACKVDMEEAVSILLGRWPESALQTDVYNRTALQIALESKAAFSIVEMLVRASPDAVAIKDADTGRTALATALHYHADYLTIALLIDACPKVVHLRDGRSRSPLQCALAEKYSDPNVMALLIASKGVVVEQDTCGRNALHIALSRYAVSAMVVHMLLEIAPEAAQVPSTKQCADNPLTIAYNYYRQASQELWYRPHSISARRATMNWWEVVGMVLNAAAPASKCKLQAAIQTDAPIEVIQTILRENPEQINIRNKRGDLPIATAIKLDARNSHCNKDDLVNLLLDHDGDDATASQLDSENRNLLSIAASMTAGRDLQPATYRRLIRSNPAALAVVDPKMKMYPLMIAACNEHPKDTGLIYELLSAAPDLLQQLTL
jgi:26S proteasome non-ATPase regulatory subunit 10